MAVYKGALYAGVWNARMTGCEIWRYSGSGTSWTKVNQNGFGTKDNNTAETLIVFGNLLYVGTGNSASGGQLWTYDGSAWTKSGNSGFGTNNNWTINALISSGSNLYAGTGNSSFGCEVWTSGAGNDSPNADWTRDSAHIIGFMKTAGLGSGVYSSPAAMGMSPSTGTPSRRSASSLVLMLSSRVSSR